MDSGASHHMSPCLEHFTALRSSSVVRVWLADDSSLAVQGEGDVCVQGAFGPLCIRSVLYIPGLSLPLFSVAAAYDHGGAVVFQSEKVELYSSSHSVPVFAGQRVGNGWRLQVVPIPCPSAGHPATQATLECAACVHPDNTPCGKPCAIAVKGADTAKAKGTWQVWHARLGHMGWQQLKHVVSQGLASGLEVEGDFPSNPVCDACLEGKMHQHPFGVSSSRASKPFELIHTDLMGPVETLSAVGRHRYIMVIVDDFTRFAWVFFLRKKSQAPERLKLFFAFVRRQFEFSVMQVRSDRGGEFLAERLTTWFAELGVVHQLSIRNTPQQNGVAERYNRTLCDRARSMLLASGLPSRFWEHAVRYANWLSNRLPTSSLPSSGVPYTQLRGKAPNLAMAKVFGCLAHVWVDPGIQARKLKFGPRAQWGVFLGVSPESKGWEFYMLATREIGYLSRNAFFHEDRFLMDQRAGPALLPDEVLEHEFGADLGEKGSDPFPQEYVAPLVLPPRDPVASLDPLEGQGEPGAPQEVSPAVDEPVLLSQQSVELIESAGGSGPPSPSLSEGEPDCELGSGSSPHEVGSPERVVGEHEDSDSDSSSIELVAETGPSEVRRSSRVRFAPERFVPLQGGKSHDVIPPRALPVCGKPAVVMTPSLSGGAAWRKGNKSQGAAFMVVPTSKWQVPTTLKQAHASSFAEEWHEARLKELGRLDEMGTWSLVDRPPGANVLGSKWVFALKTKPDGTIDRFKARLVCQGFGQKEGVDFDETFANTAGKTTVRVFLALICCLGLKVKQMDVTTAFLYGAVDKDIYMRQAPGHEDGSGRVCRLVRALYGLKQAPRIWEEQLRSSLLGMGFASSHVDPCLYVLRKDGQVLFLLHFVDDILLASHSESLIEWVSAELCKEYAMTDMGEAQKYVGLHISHDRELGEMYVHQAPYITSLGEKFGVSGTSFPDTPLPCDFVLEHPWEQVGDDPPPSFQGKADPLLSPEEHKRYQQIVGSLNYVAHSVRLDVAFAVNQLSRAMQAPRARHLAAAERCIKYLLGTASLGLHFNKRSGMFLECFVDANYSSSGSKKAITGFLLKLGGSPVYWTARKQDRITTSTCDAESYAIMTSVQYLEFVRDLLEELGCTQVTPTPLFNDNTAAVSLCLDAVSHKKSVQLTRQMAYVRERTKFGVIAPLHVRTTDQPADFLTKRLDASSFARCIGLAGLCLVPS